MPVDGLPELAMVLVNPSVGVSTPEIFKALKSKANGGLAPPPDLGAENTAVVTNYLKSTRNDLEAPAIALCPQIADVLNALTASGAIFARMSGSGATCFGIYGTAEEAQLASATIARSHEGWWVR